MAPSADTTRYLVGAGVVGLGALLGWVDWRWIRRPVFGVLLIAGVVGGIVITNVSPFDFATGGYYMEGVLISGGSALALAGYLVAAVGQFAYRRFGGRGPSR
jgi:hypothetical protein